MTSLSQSVERMRRETIISLSTLAIQEWKACGGVLRGHSLEPMDNSEFWDQLLVNLYGDDMPLRVNKYVGNFQSYCAALYKSNHRAPLVDAVPVIVRYATDTTDRIMDLIRVLGFRGQFTEEWRTSTDIHYAILYMSGVWGKNLKYHVNWLFNHYEGLIQQDRDPKIVGKDGFLSSGRPGNSINRRLRGNSLRALECRMTILQGFKKSLLPLDSRDWVTTIEDTAKTLAREPGDIDDELAFELRRTGDELARAAPDLVVRKNYTLSKSACSECPRAAGGFAGYYLKSLGFDSTVFRISPPVLVGDIRYHDSCRVGLLYSRCPYSYLDLYRDVAGGPLFERLEAGPAEVVMRVIPEPFKFRVISVGEFDVYSSLKPWQTWMWKTLQRFECFSLTGRGSDDLVDHTQRIITKYWDVGMKFLSGDYKAATNELSSYASQILAEQWFKGRPEFLYILKQSLFTSGLNFEKSMVGVDDLMPPKKGDPEEKRRDPVSYRDNQILMNSQMGAEVDLPAVGEMNNGQLMGHPCSFPILCAVNAAVCRAALEKVWKRKFSLKDIPLLVNGDDCLLIGPNSLLPTWREMTAQCGLIESVGKSYFTDRFAMINSRYLSIETAPVYRDEERLLDKTRRDIDLSAVCPIRYFANVKYDVGYVNLGILVGRKKGSNVDCEVNIADEVNDVTGYAFWQSCADNFAQMNLRCKKLQASLGMYIKSFERFFAKIPLPVHLSKDMGGYGLPGEDLVSLSRMRNPFSMRKRGAVALGEAYYSGGMATAFDDPNYPDFLARAKEVSKTLKNKVILSKECTILVAYEPPEPKSQWTVTSLDNAIRLSGVPEDTGDDDGL